MTNEFAERRRDNIELAKEVGNLGGQMQGVLLAQKNQSEAIQALASAQVEFTKQIAKMIAKMPDCDNCATAMHVVTLDQTISNLGTELKAVVREKVDPIVADLNYQRGVRRFIVVLVGALMLFAGVLIDDLGHLIAQVAQAAWHWLVGP